MANPDITPGLTIADPFAPTANNLHAIVDDAVMSNCVATALASGLGFFNYTAPASPADGDNHIDNTGLIQWHDGSAFSTDRTNPLTVLMTNGSGTNFTAGDVVIAEPGSTDTFTFSDSPTIDPRVVGVLTENVADAATTEVVISFTMR